MSVFLGWWTMEGNYTCWAVSQIRWVQIIWMEAMYKEASVWLAQTEHGVLAEVGDVKIL
jgi:hypothetical protein